MYDYFRFYIEGLTAQICQDKCIEHWQGLTGISTYDSHYCYCWFDDGELPNSQPSDIHGYSSRFKGSGEVALTLSSDDGDCYKFVENVSQQDEYVLRIACLHSMLTSLYHSFFSKQIIDTETPTAMPTDSPSFSPTPKPTNAPTKFPTPSPTLNTVVTGDYEFVGNGWCKDHKYDYYDYIRYAVSHVSACSSVCVVDIKFQGYSAYDDAYCYCWYNNNGLPTLEDYSNVLTYDGFLGEGEVKQFEPTSYSTCYRFVSK